MSKVKQNKRINIQQGNPKITFVKVFILLFILITVIIFPVFTLIRMYPAYVYSYPYFHQFSWLKPYTMINIFLSAAMILYSIFIGIHFLRSGENAVGKAKLFIIALLIYLFRFKLFSAVFHIVDPNAVFPEFRFPPIFIIKIVCIVAMYACLHRLRNTGLLFGLTKKYMVNCIIFLITSFLCLMIMEASYRIFIFGKDGLSYNKMNSINQLAVSGLIQRSSIPKVVYELKPNLRAYYKLTRFNTNSAGLRDKEYAIAKPENTIRIAVAGDSYTVPVGVEIEDAYHTLIESMLNLEQKDIRFEVINFAVPGYQLKHYWQIIQHKAKQYDPDIIIIGFCAVNDYKITPENERPYKDSLRAYPFFESYIEKDISRLFDPNRKQNEENFKKTMAGGIVLSDDIQHYLGKLFSEIGGFSRKQNIPVVVANLMNRPKCSEEIKQIVLDNGLHFVDTTAAFKGKNPEEYQIFDTHPNSKANRVFADQIYNYLVDKIL